jgi:small GTP-binding protein
MSDQFDLPDFPSGLALIRRWRSFSNRLRLLWTKNGSGLAYLDKSSAHILDTATWKENWLYAEDATMLGCLLAFFDIGAKTRPWIRELTVSPDGCAVAAVWSNHVLRIVDFTTREKREIPVEADRSCVVCWSPDARRLAVAPVNGGFAVLSSGSWDCRTISFDVDPTRPDEATHEVPRDHAVVELAWSPTSNVLALGGADGKIRLWSAEQGSFVAEADGHLKAVQALCWSPSGTMLASGSADLMVRVWDPRGRPLRILRGHSRAVVHVSISRDDRLLASVDERGTARLWDLTSGTPLALLPLSKRSEIYRQSVAFHPTEAIVAFPIEGAEWVTRGNGEIPDSHHYEDHIVLLQYDEEVLRSSRSTGARDQSGDVVRYCSAKVIIVGDSGAGKTCLARALAGLAFEPQESTHGMTVWNIQSAAPDLVDLGPVTREVVLWDLAGQPDYRIVHQLFLRETAVVILLVDPTRREEVIAAIEFWLSVVRRHLGKDIPCILVLGRTDRSGQTLDPSALEDLRSKEFAGHASTSARTGEGIGELRGLIEETIRWDRLPITTAPELWIRCRAFLQSSDRSKSVIVTGDELRGSFARANPGIWFSDDQFDSLLPQAQVHGLVVRLDVGGYLLLKPEMLNQYAASVVRAARRDPDGLGCVSIHQVLAGDIDLSDVERVGDLSKEFVLLHSVVRLLVLREVAINDDGRLVFPSKVNRRRSHAWPETRTRMCYVLGGAPEEILSALAARLHYSGAYALEGLASDGVAFRDGAGTVCAIVVSEREGNVVWDVGFSAGSSPEGQLLFLRLVEDHLKLRANVVVLSRSEVGRIGMVSVVELLDEPDLARRAEKLSHLAMSIKAQGIDLARTAAKERIGEFDVFLAYNHVDVEAAKRIAGHLRSQGLSAFVDIEQIPPGRWFQDVIQRQIYRINAAAVLFGQSNLGRWQRVEMQAFLQQCIERGMILIPVLLPGVQGVPSALPFLRALTWVRFEGTCDDPQALAALRWGITGEKRTDQEKV